MTITRKNQKPLKQNSHEYQLRLGAHKSYSRRNNNEFKQLLNTISRPRTLRNITSRTIRKIKNKYRSWKSKRHTKHQSLDDKYEIITEYIYNLPGRYRAIQNSHLSQKNKQKLYKRAYDEYMQTSPKPKTKKSFMQTLRKILTHRFYKGKTTKPKIQAFHPNNLKKIQGIVKLNME